MSAYPHRIYDNTVLSLQYRFVLGYAGNRRVERELTAHDPRPAKGFLSLAVKFRHSAQVTGPSIDGAGFQFGRLRLMTGSLQPKVSFTMENISAKPLAFM